jgi:flagellar motor switch protein FliN/FliY
MSIILDLFSTASVSTVEGLTGVAPLVTMDGVVSNSQISTPIIAAKVNVSEAASGEMIIYMPITLSTSVTDAMLGGEGEASESIDDEGLDSAKEIISQVLGSVNTDLGSQNDIPKLKFEVADIEVIEDDSSIDNSKSTVYDFDYSSQAVNAHVYIAVDDDLVDVFTNDSSDNDGFDDDGFDEGDGEVAFENSNSGFDGDDGFDDDSNMNLILDIKLPIKVRIGSKKMLLKDVINMDIGAVIELDRLVNDPLDLLVEDTVIGQGEVVIVDGNFGIQISKILSQSERIARLKE